MSIILDGVSKAFGPKVVLEDVSLQVDEGETMAVIGASGVGKSVLLKTIVGLLEPDRGRVEVDGEVVTELTRERLFELRRRVGYVFQFAALFDSMTVAENLGMGLRRMAGVDEEERDRRGPGHGPDSSVPGQKPRTLARSISPPEATPCARA